METENLLVCHECRGSGIDDGVCRDCGGTGRLTVEREAELYPTVMEQTEISAYGSNEDPRLMSIMNRLDRIEGKVDELVEAKRELETLAESLRGKSPLALMSMFK